MVYLFKAQAGFDRGWTDLLKLLVCVSGFKQAYAGYIGLDIAGLLAVFGHYRFQVYWLLFDGLTGFETWTVFCLCYQDLVVFFCSPGLETRCKRFLFKCELTGLLVVETWTVCVFFF